MQTILANITERCSQPEVKNLGPVERIPLGEGREFNVEGLHVAVFRRRSGQLHATQAKCPHRDGPLADGIIGGGGVICPLHAFKFGLETGQPLGNDCGSLRTYQVSVSQDGEILLCL